MDNEPIPRLVFRFLCLTEGMPPHFWTPDFCLHLSKNRLSNGLIIIV